MDVIVPTGWFERMLVRVLQAAYEHRLQEIAKVVYLTMFAAARRSWTIRRGQIEMRCQPAGGIVTL
jgi:hypothetical protein